VSSALSHLSPKLSRERGAERPHTAAMRGCMRSLAHSRVSKFPRFPHWNAEEHRRLLATRLWRPHAVYWGQVTNWLCTRMINEKSRLKETERDEKLIFDDDTQNQDAKTAHTPLCSTQSADKCGVVSSCFRPRRVPKWPYGCFLCPCLLRENVAHPNLALLTSSIFGEILWENIGIHLRSCDVYIRMQKKFYTV